MSNKNIAFLSVLIFQACFINISYLGNLNKYIQVVFTILAIIMLFNKTHLCYIYKFKKLNVTVFLYCIALIISSFYGLSFNIVSLNKYIISTNTEKLNEFANPLVSISCAFSIFTIFIFVEYLNIINKRYMLLKVFFVLSLFYSLLNDILMFVNHVDFSSVSDVYLLGNKFNVAYLHLFCTIIYFFRKKADFKFYVLLFFTILISHIIQSSTGIISGIIILFCILFKKYLKIIFYNPIVVIVLIGLMSTFFFVFINFLDYSFVQYIVVDILHEDLTLTGRTILYSYLWEVMNISPIWGIGYLNSYSLMRYLYGFPNTQNGLITVWIEQGIIGIALFIYLIIQCVKYRQSQQGRFLSYPVMSLIILYIILSSIEITFGREFIFLLALLILIPEKYTINKNQNFNKL